MSKREGEEYDIIIPTSELASGKAPDVTPVNAVSKIGLTGHRYNYFITLQRLFDYFAIVILRRCSMFNNAKEVIGRTAAWAAADPRVEEYHKSLMRQYECLMREKAIECGVLRPQPRDSKGASSDIGDIADCHPTLAKAPKMSVRLGHWWT